MKSIFRWLWFMIPIALFFLGVNLLLVFYWLFTHFHTTNFNALVIYLNLPRENLPLDAIDREHYVYGLAVQFACGLALTATFAWLRALCRRRETIFGLGARRFGFAMWLTAILSLSGSLYAFETRYDIGKHLFADAGYASYVEDHFQPPRAEEIVFPGEKRNLILLILESVETTVNDPKLFQAKLMPRLDDIGKKNLAFSGYRPTTGTTSSLLSFYSLNLGMPFVTYPLALFTWDSAEGPKLDPLNLNVGKFAERHDFRDRSLLGVMERNGYRVEMLTGADIRAFAYDRLIRMSTDHCGIYDRNYFQASRADCSGHMNAWGIDDSYLYARARERLLAVQGGGKPFFSIIQTVNTHPPGFYEKGRPRKFGDFRDSFEQGDAMAGEFIEWILAQPFARETAIVVMGDHNLAISGLGPIRLPPTEKREIMLIFINSAPGRPKRGQRRAFAAWDLAPTILEAAGARVPGRRFGLGTSLFSDRDTLLERDGLEKFNEMITKRSRLYEKSYYWY
ncbi:MAG: sulfatase-like hydrolase/transferase [Planctomycetota bacterium]|nr:sulfatase-like hydrolase/transferase [Planctomycetota bacterium]